MRQHGPPHEPATCHPYRKTECRGLCQQCYLKLRAVERARELDYLERGSWFCRRCETEKPASDFYRNRNKPRNQCKACDIQRTVVYNRSRSQRDPSFREYVRNHVRISSAKNTRKYNLKKNHNLTLEAYDDLLTAQGGICPICLRPPQGKPLDVDHDHESGQIRGLLHNPCNKGLGDFVDDIERLEGAIQYLRNSRQKAVATLSRAPINVGASG